MIMQVLKNSLESLHNVYPASQSKITCWYGTGPTSKMDGFRTQSNIEALRENNDRESLFSKIGHLRCLTTLPGHGLN